MLFILIAACIWGIVIVTKDNITVTKMFLASFLTIGIVVMFIMICFCVSVRIDRATTIPKKIEAIERHNYEIISQLQPSVLRNTAQEKLKYYDGSVKGMITLCSESELQSLPVIKMQAQILIENQKEIYQLQQQLAELEQFKILLFAF